MAEHTPPGGDEPTEADVPAVELLAPDPTAGFCDPVTGVCTLPEADAEDGPVETAPGVGRGRRDEGRPGPDRQRS